MPRSRVITRDSAHQPMRLTTVIDHTDDPKNRYGQCVYSAVAKFGALELVGHPLHVRDACDDSGERR